MQFFGVSNPEEVPKLADGTMVFIEHVRSVSYNYFSEIRGHTIVMDNNKYCEYDFMGFGLGVSAIFFDSYVSGGYVFGEKTQRIILAFLGESAQTALPMEEVQRLPRME